MDSPSAFLLTSATVFLLVKLVAIKKGANLPTAIKAGIVPAIGDLLPRILAEYAIQLFFLPLPSLFFFFALSKTAPLTCLRTRQGSASVAALGSIAQLVNYVADHQDATLLISQHPALIPSLVSLLRPSHFLLAQVPIRLKKNHVLFPPSPFSLCICSELGICCSRMYCQNGLVPPTVLTYH